MTKKSELYSQLSENNKTGGNRMKSVAFCTLGCKVNQYETDAMEEIFQKGGYEIRDFHEKADIYVINTCTVTNMADRKSRQMLHRARKKKMCIRDRNTTLLIYPIKIRANNTRTNNGSVTL